LVETHLWVGTALTDMPQTRKGNPKIGNFPYKSGDITGQTTYTFIVDLGLYGGEATLCATDLLAAAHAALQLVDDTGTVIQTETGWGNGNPMVDRGSWATYFGIQFTCADVPPGQNSETAFAYDCWDALCFIDIPDEGFHRWGWTNGAYGPGTYYLDIYAGAGRCDIGKGTLVGLLTVDYDGEIATITYNTCGDYTMTETHLYVGNDILHSTNDPDDPDGPGYTVAPGQYPYSNKGLDNVQTDVYTVDITGDIYVVAHAVVWGDYDAGDCGERGCVPPCVPGFDYDGFQQEIDDANAVGGMQMKVTYPIAGGEAYFIPTYIDYDGDGIAEVTTESWCVDIGSTISNNTWYCAVLFSSYEDLTGLVDKPLNMDLVNYIMNQDYVYKISPLYGTAYTYGDVQRAIWTVIDNTLSTSGLGSYNQARVDEIVAAAFANGEAYEPPCGGVVGAVLVPVSCGTTTPGAQVIIAQVVVADYPAICTECP